MAALGACVSVKRRHVLATADCTPSSVSPCPETRLTRTAVIEWFAGEAERIHGEYVPPANLNQRIITMRQPVGVAACMTPWNFPIAMITRKAGAALAAGCTTVWKPAGETPLSAMAQAVLAEEAGFPKGAINIVLTLNNVAEIGKKLCEDKRVRKMSFTGSTRVGKILAAQCASSLTKLTLELGGNSPFIVFDDCKIETAVEAAIMAKFRNSGQTCVTANRIFVQKGIYDKFAEALTERIRKLKVGAGWEKDVFVGPLTHDRAVEKAMAHIDGQFKTLCLSQALPRKEKEPFILVLLRCYCCPTLPLSPFWYTTANPVSIPQTRKNTAAKSSSAVVL